MQTRIKISRQRQNEADTPAQCLVPHSVRKQEVQVELRWADKKKDPTPNHGPEWQRRQITCPTAFEKDEAQTSLSAKRKDHRKWVPHQLHESDQQSSFYQGAQT